MGLRWGAIVLAAGSGSRMGTRPKCLLELQGQPLIQRHLSMLSELGLTDSVVVLGHHAQAIEGQLTGVAVVMNPAANEGQNGSLHLGLQALAGQVDAVVVILADQPLVDAAAVQDLMSAFKSRDAQTEVLVPWHPSDNVPGNPVAFSARVRTDILKSPSQWGCKQWQQAHPAQVQRWVSDNPAYFTDLDTPDDVMAFQARTGLRLRWPG